jgi:hypothetical protein
MIAVTELNEAPAQGDDIVRELIERYRYAERIRHV